MGINCLASEFSYFERDQSRFVSDYTFSSWCCHVCFLYNLQHSSFPVMWLSINDTCCLPIYPVVMALDMHHDLLFLSPLLKAALFSVSLFLSSFQSELCNVTSLTVFAWHFVDDVFSLPFKFIVLHCCKCLWRVLYNLKTVFFLPDGSILIE